MGEAYPETGYNAVLGAVEVAKVKVAIVGSGPGGIGAACHAAELGVSHVLLESAPHLSNTIYLYQKGKHVMDEPGVLPLHFFEGQRFASILSIEKYGLSYRYLARPSQPRIEPRGQLYL